MRAATHAELEFNALPPQPQFRPPPRPHSHRCACGGTVGPSGECQACGRNRLATDGWANAPLSTRVADSVVNGSPSPSGRALDPTTRALMEERFGHDFGQVRVHTDRGAAASAVALDAVAFTVGSDIIMRPEHYRPASHWGRRLIAHELAHVVQQRGGGGGWAGERELEGDAERAARHVARGRSASPRTRAQAGSVQRAAPAAAAGGAALSAYAARCIVGAAVGAVFDLVIQYGLHSWRRWRPPWERETAESFRPDWCSVVLSAVLGCLGGIVALRWLEPFLKRAFPALSGAGATILGRLLMWVAQKAGIGVPRAAVKWLLKWGCISAEEAEAVAPGVSGEAVAEAPRATEASTEAPA